VRNADTGLLAATGWLVDICVGASGSEVVVIENLAIYATSSTDELATVNYGPIYCDIPAGSRLSLRVQCSATDASDRIVRAVAHLFG
jgi:hypothetical protein